ncbi:hypothetical protein JKP88DRAFT_256118 [Tribonema minus]|uniref:Uncharacterized protein n=1 Tax=Tribonema minus TaxID=303371 RepID=A0A835YM97_9STRA|nr:hypothetical protein JKP88DRAFT_249508 [Tribonema minus]KAG5178850.1 hypothetical protein JKP88DRAFT_247955 [Tribonema minus]KAG5181064.1 hypothetical protein JKP88DRAFT_256118 [Tribonema minus]
MHDAQEVATLVDAVMNGAGYRRAGMTSRRVAHNDDASCRHFADTLAELRTMMTHRAVISPTHSADDKSSDLLLRLHQLCVMSCLHEMTARCVIIVRITPPPARQQARFNGKVFARQPGGMHPPQITLLTDMYSQWPTQPDTGKRKSTHASP